MKKEKMIKSFESISKYDIYSKYNSVLDKKFKDRSLKFFIYSLKYKKYKEKAPFLEEFYKKYPYEFEKNNITEEDKANFLNELNIEDEKEIKNKDNNQDNKKIQLRFSYSTRKYDNDYPDPFKYNPNYNSIYKKVPSFKISPKRKEIPNIKTDKVKKNIVIDSKLNKNNKNLILYDSNMTQEEKKIFLNKIKQINTSLNQKNNNNNFNNSNRLLNSAKKNKNLDLPLITTTNIIYKKQDNNNTIETCISRDNHALRFSKYLPRKNTIANTTNQISYLEHYDYMRDNKKTLDFGKMKARDNKSIINTSELEIPPVGKYYPKYNLVENVSKNVIFSPFGKNRNSKKNILQKMLGSYKVLSEYQTIDNEKLFNDNDIINKQLILKYNLNP